MIEAIKRVNDPDTFKITLASLDQNRGRWWYHSTFVGADGGLITVRYGFDVRCSNGMSKYRLYHPRLSYQIGGCTRLLYPCSNSLAEFDSLYDALVDVVQRVFLYT